MEIRNNRNVLYIIGAGASVATGVPAMSTFVDKMYDLFVGDSHYAKVFDALSQLRKAYANADIDLNNIESVLATFDMGRVTRQLGNVEGDSTDDLYNLLVQMIVKTVEQTTAFKRGEGGPEVEGFYAAFVKHALAAKKSMMGRIDFLSFNYDIALDYTLAQIDECRSSLPHSVDYGFGSNTDKPQLLKLHGSVNWSHRDDSIIAYPFDVDMLKQELGGDTLHYETNLAGHRQLAQLRFSSSRPMHRTFIVPPSFSKSFDKFREVQRSWGRAAELLAEAHVIAFIGYSVPATDLMFRYLFSIGTLKNDRIRKIVVLNSDPGAEQVYRSFLGQFTQKRLEFICEKFDGDGIAALYKAVKAA